MTTTTTAPGQQQQQQQQPGKDPMRFHRHYQQGKSGGFSLRRRQQLHGARLRARSKRNGDRRVPRHQLSDVLAWVLVNHVIRSWRARGQGCSTGRGSIRRRSSC